MRFRGVRPVVFCGATAEQEAARTGKQTVFFDEVFRKSNGVQRYLRRAADQPGAVLDLAVQPERDRFAAECLLGRFAPRPEREPPVLVGRQTAQRGGGATEGVAAGRTPAEPASS